MSFRDIDHPIKIPPPSINIIIDKFFPLQVVHEKCFIESTSVHIASHIHIRIDSEQTILF